GASADPINMYPVLLIDGVQYTMGSPSGEITKGGHVNQNSLMSLTSYDVENNRWYYCIRKDITFGQHFHVGCVNGTGGNVVVVGYLWGARII
ncbi:unnamed protein product, partial [marine sediment metagenome]